MLGAHWEDDRWREVILLAAGQLGVVENKPYDASAFLLDLRQMEPSDPANTGRPAVLAGRALADIGGRGVNQATRRDVMRELRQTMQDLDPDTDRPNEPPRIAPRTRYASGEAWDELGWLPEDLDAWCCARSAQSLRQAQGRFFAATLLVAKYPVTNTQFERFIQDKGYDDPKWWGGDRPRLDVARNGRNPYSSAGTRISQNTGSTRASARTAAATPWSASRGMRPQHMLRG